MRAPIEQFQVFPICLPAPFPAGDVNVILYKGGEALTLFDAAVNTDDAWEALKSGLKAHGVAVSDLERLVLTHHHFDHFGLVNRIADAADVEICGHPGIPHEIHQSYCYDEEHTRFHVELLRGFGAPEAVIDEFIAHRNLLRPYIEHFSIDRPLPDKSEIDGFCVWHVPGHAPTDTLFVRRQMDFAITGDHFLETVNPNPIIRRPAEGEERPKSLIQYQESLRVTRSLEFSWAFPGHGNPIHDHRRVIDGILTQHEKRNTRILAMLPTEGMTPYAVTEFLYSSMIPETIFFCLSIAVGQLEVLESRGHLTSRWEEGVLRYYPARTN